MMMQSSAYRQNLYPRLSGSLSKSPSSTLGGSRERGSLSVFRLPVHVLCPARLSPRLEHLADVVELALVQYLPLQAYHEHAVVHPVEKLFQVHRGLPDVCACAAQGIMSAMIRAEFIAQASKGVSTCRMACWTMRSITFRYTPQRLPRSAVLQQAFTPVQFLLPHRKHLLLPLWCSCGIRTLTASK